MIMIVDYGVGNIRAFLNSFRRLNIQVKTATSDAELRGASKVILPGVGHFDHAMQLLDRSGMRGTLDHLVHKEKRPVLGVCVGMQMLAGASDEGSMPGLGWIPGRVRRLGASNPQAALPLPHMGWNDVRVTSPRPLFERLDAGARFYFLHSYYFDADRPADVAAVASYGSEFACAVSSENIHGVQFHPEKSHHFGTQLLRNFADL